MTDDHFGQKLSPIVEHDDIMYPSAVPFVLVHLACLAAIWTGVTYQALAIGVALYWLRIFGIGAGYHRYFSHRSFRTSRLFQFALAFLSQSSAQKSVLWWASKHRHHHLNSDTEGDIHSPRYRGFVYSHFGWIFARSNDTTDLVKIADFAGYRELVWLHKYELLPAFVLALICLAIGGWPGLIVGFFWSTVLVYHATFCINSLAHVRGRRRYVTADDSRNNWLLAVFTMGEGWHNNHHAYQSSVRQGFRWWEIDPTFYILKVLSLFGLVWDLRVPPLEVRRNQHRLGSRVIERAAAQLVGSFDLDVIINAIADFAGPDLSSIQETLAKAQNRAADVFAGLHLSHLPTRQELVRRASAMFTDTPSMDSIVSRAHAVILETIGARLSAKAAAH